MGVWIEFQVIEIKTKREQFSTKRNEASVENVWTLVVMVPWFLVFLGCYFAVLLCTLCRGRSCSCLPSWSDSRKTCLPAFRPRPRPRACVSCPPVADPACPGLSCIVRSQVNLPVFCLRPRDCFLFGRCRPSLLSRRARAHRTTRRRSGLCLSTGGLNTQNKIYRGEPLVHTQ